MGGGKTQILQLPTALNTTTYTTMKCTVVVRGDFDLLFTMRKTRGSALLMLKNLTITRLRTLSYLPSEEIVTQEVEYRYGYNGQMKTDEISGSGNHYTAEFWEYDPRLGRRWNLDPVGVAWESGYAANRNNPIWYNDPNGDCPDCPDPSTASEGDVVAPNGVDYEFSGGEWQRVGGTLPEVSITPEGGYPSANPSLGTTNQTGYTYNKLDLQVRNDLLTKVGEGNIIVDAMLRFEREGNFQPLHSKNYYQQYVERYGTDDAFYFGIEGGFFAASLGAGLAGATSSAGPSTTPRGLSLRSSAPSSNASSSNVAKAQQAFRDLNTQGKVTRLRLQNNQEVNLKIESQNYKMHFRVETHQLPGKYTGGQPANVRHANVQLFENVNCKWVNRTGTLPNGGHIILE